eukprot:TRINITY_DN4951_c0_g1_i1.p2 TRINITY_DN4951_c0_g1~~TRINITY_DN4951_c0_g1_i1.p2  ORF type:complete len:139 (-),score=16.99 TRINITY_DN4951_c0_g1_i1:670-1086(-)
MSIPPPEVLFNVDEFEDDDDIEFSQYNIKRLIVSSLLFSWFSDITLYPIILVNTRLKIQGQVCISAGPEYSQSSQEFPKHGGVIRILLVELGGLSQKRASEACTGASLPALPSILVPNSFITPHMRLVRWDLSLTTQK